MDDGASTSKSRTYRFSTQWFPLSDQEILVQALRYNLSIAVRRTVNKERSYCIYSVLGASPSAQRFFELIRLRCGRTTLALQKTVAKRGLGHLRGHPRACARTNFSPLIPSPKSVTLEMVTLLWQQQGADPFAEHFFVCPKGALANKRVIVDCNRFQPEGGFIPRWFYC